jgi:hypothetical protein
LYFRRKIRVEKGEREWVKIGGVRLYCINEGGGGKIREIEIIDRYVSSGML